MRPPQRRSTVLGLSAGGTAVIAGAILSSVIFAGIPSARAAPRLLGDLLNIAADELTTDTAGATVVARGHVQVAYGGAQAKSDLFRLNRPARAAELSGHVVVTDPRGRASGDAATLRLGSNDQIVSFMVTGHAGFESPKYALMADQITADQRSGHLVAAGHITAFSAPDLIITGERGAYDQRAQYGVVTGHAAASNKDGRLQGDWIELFRAAGRAVVHGPVEANVSGATITGDQATINFRTSAAVFTGRVVVTRRQGTVWADRATVFYGDRRIIAEGAARATLADVGDGTP
jgi:lipopolysaccharide assembly outer membrane protein LptD (OstA)